MTDLEQRVRRDLATVVREQPIPALPAGPDYRARSRRRAPALVAITAAAAAVVLVVVGVVFALAGRGPSGVPKPQGGPAVWPARGSLAGDVALTNAAMRTWEALPLPARELPHRDVVVMYAERTLAGDVVVLTGVDAFGHRRVAEFDTDATSTTPFRHRLHLVADLLAPTGSAAGLVVIDAPRPTPGKSDDGLLVVVAAPGTKHLQWHTDDWHWHDLPSTDGAGAIVHARSLNTWARAGAGGDGMRTSGTFSLSSPMATPIDHQQDPEEIGKASGDASLVCHRSGSTDECSASVQATITARAPSAAGWTDIRDSYAASTSSTGQTWWEFGEVLSLYADTLDPNAGFFEAPGWSGILPDGTGVMMETRTPSNGPTHVLTYVDRPEWGAGRVFDEVAGGPVRAYALEVLSTNGRTLAIVVTDGLRAQYAISGQGVWRDIATAHNIAVTQVPIGASVSWRVVDATGAVVASGSPHVVTPH